MLTLEQARLSGRLVDFVAQEEARGVGAAEKSDLDRALAALIKSPRSEDQTSRSSSRDGSSGTKIR